jgi:hypothetical protein
LLSEIYTEAFIKAGIGFDVGSMNLANPGVAVSHSEDNVPFGTCDIQNVTEGCIHALDIYKNKIHINTYPDLKACVYSKCSKCPL